MIQDNKMENWGEGRYKIINMRKVIYYEYTDLTVIIYMQKLLHEF